MNPLFRLLQDPRDAHRLEFGVLPLITFFWAFGCAIGMMLTAENVARFASNTLWGYASITGFFWLGTGAGTAINSRLNSQTQPTLWINFLKTNVFLSPLVGLSSILIPLAHTHSVFFWTHGHFQVGIMTFFASAAGLAILTGFLSAQGFTLLIALENSYAAHRSGPSKIILPGALGYLIGSIIFPTLLLPNSDLIFIGFGTGLGYALLAILISLQPKTFVISKFWLTSNIIAAMLLVVGIFYSSLISHFFLTQYYSALEHSETYWDIWKHPRSNFAVTRHRSKHETIDAVKVPVRIDAFYWLPFAYSQKFQNDPDFPKDYLVYLNTSFRFWSNFEEFPNEYFAHVPIQLAGRVPQKILILGGGEGLLARELLKYREISSITIVDNTAFPRLASTDPLLRRLNKDAFADPRIKVIQEDVFTFVNRSSEIYDAIYLDLPNPRSFDLSRTHSLEFYRNLRRHLTASGFLSLPVARTKSDPKYSSTFWDIPFSTLSTAGFSKIVPLITLLETNNPDADFLLSNLLGDDIESLTVRTNDIVSETQPVTITGKEAIFEHILSDFSLDQEHYFLIAFSVRPSLNTLFTDFGISLHVLNPSRFKLAMDRSLSTVIKPDPKKVHSLITPKLPNPEDWWQLQLPY